MKDLENNKNYNNMKNIKNFEVALVNELCPVCLKDAGGFIAMNERLTPADAAKIKEMNGKHILADHLCDKCNKAVEDNTGEDNIKPVWFVEVDEEKTTDERNPYRTGFIFMLKRSFVETIMPDFNKDQVICYISKEVVNKIGIREQMK